jgi:dipeptidyl aminopeptidase/acylaminoacyl peptidase
MTRIAFMCLAAIAVPVLAQSQPAKPEGQMTFEGEIVKNRPNEAIKATPLIPREVLFGNPERSRVTISPDGQTISWLAPNEGVMNIWVAPVTDVKAGRCITADKRRGIRQYQWAYNGMILYMQDEGGDENWKVFAVNPQGGPAKDLTPFTEIKGPDGKPITMPDGRPLRPRAEIEHISKRFPDVILIGLNNRNPRHHDLYRCNIKTGELTLVQKNDEYDGFLVDDDFTIRLAMQTQRDGSMNLLKADGKGGFALSETIPQEDSMTTRPAGFDASGKTLYWTETRGRNTAALIAVDTASGAKKVLAEDAKADVSGSIAHPETGKVQAVSFNYDRERWVFVDDSIRPDIEVLQKTAEGDVIVSGRSQNDSRWTVAFRPDNGPIRYYVYDRAAKKAEYLFSNQPKLESMPLSRMTPVVITSRDGLNLVSYLTVPTQYDRNNDGRPDAGPIPMVLMVHGGPWARDAWGYNPYHQWLANRGYAVLSVNYRGSTGFGKSFINAGDGQWAGKMHDDLIDAVNWAVDQKIAKKDRVGIMGGSYGGYATLVGLTFTPDVFACGVDIVGPSSLTTLLENIPPYWYPFLPQLTTRVGDHRTPEGRKFLDSRSPLNFVDRIARPLLIGQGANDPRVKQQEADQIVAAMQKKGIPVTYVLFPDEGHGFQRPENNKSFNAVTEQFLSQHLGGASEPITNDFDGSSITIPTGADLVYGLTEALSGKK